MKSRIFIILTVITVLVAVILSCQAMAAITDAGAQIAGATGVIDQNTADALSVSARAIGSAAEQITPEQEYFIGRAVAANLLSTYRLWNGNANLTAYLNRICMAIVINSPRPDIFNGYRVAILDSNEINAFATPGGHIFITRGLINTARSEDALAAVIAHEVAHIQLQHSIKAIKNSRVTNALMVTGVAATGAATGMNVNELTSVFNESIGEIMQTLVSNGFSRDQEFESDNTAMALLAKAGYNPQALIEMLQALPTIGSTGFSSTHPTPAQRVTNAQRTVNTHRVTDTGPSRTARFTTATR
jgi:predicted Zn-dependent protease